MKMTARERVMKNRYTPNLTRQILHLLEGHHASHSILALNIVMTVLKAELDDQSSPEVLDILSVHLPAK
jgi:hypothetical protein